MQLVACGITDVGVKRDRNEDAFLINDDLRLYVVADGMGGHAGGEVASALAVNTVDEVLAATDIDVAPGDAHDPVDALRQRVALSVRKAGERILAWAASHPEFRGMGTTAVVLLIQGANAFIAHIGDSRLYAVRDGVIEQVTEDHSLVAQSIREGLMTAEQARTHRMRNVITKALGFEHGAEPDITVRALRRGDIFLLCTDGLSGKVEDAELCDHLLRYDPQEAARQLVGLACARGGEDNITAIIVHVDDAA